MSVSKNGKHKSITSIADLKPDTKNANKGSQRGRGLLEKSLRRYGAGRSVVVDRDGLIIAGNKTIDVAAELDLPVKVVQTNGEEVVVVQRTDLDIDSEAGRGLAIADNRTSEVSLDWDPETLADLSDTVDLFQFWGDDELTELLRGLNPFNDLVDGMDLTVPTAGYQVVVDISNRDELTALTNYLDGAEVEYVVNSTRSE